MMFMFWFLFLSFFCTCNGAGEIELLLSFKSSINDPFQFLSSWDSSVSFCNWSGVACNNNSNSIAIDLSAKKFSGKISSSSIFHLPSVESINLSSNQLSGEIPGDIFSFSSNSQLRYLNLSNNNFTGPIPSGISLSRRLEVLDLSNNMLSGKIPQEIGFFFLGLKYLDLGGNVLAGEIPVSISNITSLQSLTLASNQLTGPIPRELGQLKGLKWIYFGYNNLSGEIPEEIGGLTSLYHLDLVYNNLSGEIPLPLGNLSNLQYLFLYQNKLRGSVPKSLFGLKKLVSLDLSDNSLSGEIPEDIIQLQNLEILHLFSNNFTGKIPNSLASLPKLQVLQLWSNQLSGEIPSNLGKFNNFTVLDLSTNFLTGKIPGTLCDSGTLTKLILFSNSLEGEIPKSLRACKSLRRVRLQNNRLSGRLPSGLFTRLSLVYFLDLSGNNLSGIIGEQEWHMTSLQMLNLSGNKFSGSLPESFGARDQLENLDLSDNEFSGPIPESFGSLSVLVQLKLSKNKLSGEIPEELSSCKQLVRLDLSSNKLSGPIPVSFSEMPVLGQLDLSDNQLSGEIPQNLGRVASLVQVNISHNHFHGSLPTTGAFLAINSSAVVGNNLCDSTTSSRLPLCRANNKNRNPTWTWWFLVSCLLGALMMLSLVAFAIVTLIRKRKTLELMRVENGDEIFEIQFLNFKVAKSLTMEDIISCSAKQDNLISSSGKKGVSSSLYKVRSSANDRMQFVVHKVIDVNNSGIIVNTPSFWSDVSQFRRLNHPNIVKLIGVCRSGNAASYYWVYEYIEGKQLSEVIPNLTWERRRKIATGIGKALSYLHCHCSPSVFVGDVSSEKVIVDGDDVPLLRLRLPGVAIPDTGSYYAPESKDITEKGHDIYGFGVILIELLTGKSPTDAEFGVHKSIVEWARYCYSDRHLDTWVDPLVGGHASSNQNEIVETMNLALQCTAVDPTARPCASDVVKALHRCSGSSCLSGYKFCSRV